MKYTLKTIKKTKCYKANVEAVRAMFPGHEEDFARELMIAANNNGGGWRDNEYVSGAFYWHLSPQGYAPWEKLTTVISIYAQLTRINKEQNKND
ncbi:CUE domain containing protein [uncultured Caudovirales phage]|uniref:CUE domain containing protein n=1 Tax=uncultured Caudovirales phage TaxID=2100421 RepID=A0A6J5P2U0_9CAUD|nr:CUE domain containing protein [uncultured Caudovirales phage]